MIDGRQRSESRDWYTPAHVIEYARAVLGHIDLDPASSDEANEFVGATKIYTSQDDGLEQEWCGKVWINPPYGRYITPKWVRRLLHEYDRRAVTEAVTLLNRNSSETIWFRPLWDFPMCFPEGRLSFRRPGQPQEEAKAGNHGSVLVYLGDRPDRFAKVFRALGPIYAPYTWENGNGGTSRAA